MSDVIDLTTSIATLASAIQTGIDSSLKEVHTQMPGIVETFNAELQTAKIQPAIKRVFRTGDGEAEFLTPTALPPLINVPIIYPRGGGFSLTFPVKPGDECLIEFCERAIDGWHEYGKVQEPTSRRFHAYADAVAFVGLSSKPNKVPNYSPDSVQLKHDNGDVSLTLNPDGTYDVSADNGITVVSSAGDIDVTANQGDITVTADLGNISAIATAGNIEASAVAGQIDMTAATTINATAPTINLNGAVNIQGLLTMFAGFIASGGASGQMNGDLHTNGALTNNGSNVGSTHSHNQGSDSAGDSQQPVGPPF
jgi:phage baseplate assembly protein gpV